MGMATHRAPHRDPETPAFELPAPTFPAPAPDADKTARGAAAAVDASGGSSPSASRGSTPAHGAPEVVGAEGEGDVQGFEVGATSGVEEMDGSKGGWFAYVRTRDFYVVLVLG